MDKMVRPGRVIFCTVLLLFLNAVYAVSLYKLQVVEGAAYAETSRNNVVNSRVVKAARGNILDRYGRTLISNRSCNNIIIDTDELYAQEDPNAVILAMVNLVRACGDNYNDTLLPVTANSPFEYVDNMTALQRMALESYIKNANDIRRAGLGNNPTAVDLMAYIRGRYNIDSNYTAAETRIIAGVRYETNIRHIIDTSDYVFVEDASIELITMMMEQNMPGFDVEVSFIREYNTLYGSHLLGYVGQLYPDEFESYKKLGYSMDAMVGKMGVEQAFETYLHGKDGKALVTSTANGTVIGSVYEVEPEPGDNIYLTIDIGLQEAMEVALQNGINTINTNRVVENEAYVRDGEPDKVKAMAPGGAIVVVSVKTGEPLGIANYPSYNLNTFLEDYEDLREDPANPLFNRAIMGQYLPGSTFKPITALAALKLGKITTTTTYVDQGKFTKYADAGYAPQCWVFPNNHGEVNVVSAIENSCNYFFYEVSDVLGIDEIAKYGMLFGLGVHTGIELTENIGRMSTQAFKEEALGEKWFAGDTLQAGMGQSFSEFTPLQIAEYVATIANSGTRYSASILKSVRNYDYTQEIYARSPMVLDTIDIDQEHFDAIHQGMRAVALTGTASKPFEGFKYTVAAKTGTAQLGTSVNNAVFVCYAPADDPEIAVAVVVEKGGAGSTIASIAREVLEFYFNFAESSKRVESELQLLR